MWSGINNFVKEQAEADYDDDFDLRRSVGIRFDGGMGGSDEGFLEEAKASWLKLKSQCFR